ncbi:unnamed protein product, partial [Symbiodinium sp. KB8]
AKADAALQALRSPETFTKFVEYATLDAVITWRLFNHLKLRLLERPWITEVHKLRVSQLLNDDAAADAIAAELRTYGTKPKPFSCARRSTKTSEFRSLAGTPGTVQLRTGQTMWNFYQQNLRELPECLAKMQDRGVPVDAATLARLEDISRKDLETKTNLLRETLKSIRKPDGSLLCEDASAININSSQQLQTLLFGGARNKFNSLETLQVTRSFHSAEGSGKKRFELSSLGLEPGKKSIDFTDKGWPSTRKEAVAQLRSRGEVKRQLAEAGFNEEAVGNVEAALGYLSDCKQIETNARMLTALQKAVVKDRIHPSWQFATSTGRLTCSQPNLHSLVAGTKDIYGVRAAFKAQPGHKLVLADYSQLELRILAHISQCRIMSQGLHQGGDYHAQVAVEMFDHVREAVEKDGVTVDNSGAQTVRHSAQESADRQGLVLRCLPIPLAIMGIMDLTVGDLTPEKGEKKCCCCCCSCFGFIIFILFITSFQQVNRLHAGLLRNGLTGEVGLERAYLQGRYFVGFWNEFVHFPTTLNTIEFADEAVEEGVQQLGKLRSRDKDGKQIWLDVSVQYRIYPEELPQIYREMTKVYEDVYISELRGALQQVTNEFAIDQAWRDYPSVQKKMHDVCKAVLLQRHAECWGLQLWGIRLQVEYENQLIRTQVRKQAEETARATQLQTEYRQKTEVILAEYVANVTIINQKGVADKNRIERDSVSAAQSALVTAQGEVLKIVQDEVKLNATEWMPERIMTPEQLVQYQRILMLKNKKSANFAVKSIGQSQSVSTSHHDTALCVLAVPCVRGPRRILSGYRMLPRNVPESAFPEERNRAKAVNFGIIYGMTSSRLAEDLDIPKEEATALMQAWYKNKPMVQSWKKRVEEHAQQEQVSLSLLGRERHLPLLDDQASAFYREKSKRAAVNFAIQGSAADVVTAVMLQLENCQELKQMGYHMIMQVHDEIILDGPEEHAEKAAEILREIMMKPFKEIQQNYEFRVPLEVNIAIGDTLQAKETGGGGENPVPLICDPLATIMIHEIREIGGCPLSHENKLVMQRRQIGFWKKTSSAVVPFDQEAQCDRRNEVKLLTPDAQSKLGSTSNSTACSDDVMHRPELRTPTPGSSPSESTCSYTTGSANVSMDPPSSPLAESEDDRRTSLRSTAVAPPHSPRVVEEVLQDSTKEATPDFKLSPSEIYAAVAAEFGEETASLLQSTKWDKRQRGLQSISAVLNGSDLEGVAVALPGSARSTKGLFRERAAAWEVSCLVLNHVLRDKVIPVGLTALELFRDTFQNIDVSISAAQVQHAVSVLIEHVMFRIGDSNVRLHEGARRDLVLAASRQLLGIGGVLDRLQQRLETAPPKGGERNKVMFGILDTVAEIIRSYSESSSTGPPSPHTWSIDVISGFIAAGMEESLGPRVRNSSVALAAAVYRLRGPKVAETLMAGLRPAKKALLREKFQEIDEEGGSGEPEEEEDSQGGDVRPDLDDCLHVCSALPVLPGVVAGEEESLMDGILEETGLVFNGAGIHNDEARRRSIRKSVSFCQEDDIVEVEQHQDEELLLDHEVWALGIDVEEIDEQEALLREILMGSEDEDEDTPRTPIREPHHEVLSVDAC